MSTQAALEEQAWTALLDVNTHRLQAHRTMPAANLTASRSAFEDIATAARAGIAALDAVAQIRESVRLAELAAACPAPVNDCVWFRAEDDQCRFSAVPHEPYCDRHFSHAASHWDEAHEATDCCPVHCEDAVHTIDGEEVNPG